MIHPKKKFSSDLVLTDAKRKEMEATHTVRPIRTGKRPPPDTPLSVVIDHSGEERVVRGFQIMRAGAPRLTTPEPDLTVVLFHSAYLSWNALKEIRTEMENRLSAPRVSEQVLDDLFKYYSVTTNLVSSLWMSLESAINRQFLDHHVYQRKGGNQAVFKGGQLADLGMEDKIKLVLPEITGKRYRGSKGNMWEDLFRLKDLRDEILHPKTEKGQGLWAPLYRKLYAHNYKRSLDAVRSFINFYEGNDLIEDCGCGKKW